MILIGIILGLITVIGALTTVFIIIIGDLETDYGITIGDTILTGILIIIILLGDLIMAFMEILIMDFTILIEIIDFTIITTDIIEILHTAEEQFTITPTEGIM